MSEVVDLYVPAGRGSLMRSIQIHRVGKFRISRRDCELYSVQVTGNGSFSRMHVTNGFDRKVFVMPSPFTGSFWLSGFAAGGLVVHLHAGSDNDVANVTVNFRERDRKVV